ncbi:hypothetical protein UlMin_036604 [Ulmus minor]
MLNMEKRWKPIVEIAPNCPRCASSNTKFCYYNNYSLSQPRYFCKGCRRYWTKGGSIRNVPVGGGCRKNRRAKFAKPPMRDRVSSMSIFSQDSNGSENSNGDSGRANGSDIDLAVVFANFLNQKSIVEPESVEVNAIQSDSGNSSNTWCAEKDGGLDQFQKQSNLVQDGDFLVHEQEQRIEEVGNEISEFELSDLLGDDQEVAEDVFNWSDSSEAMASNFTWQPMVNLQELESFPSSNPMNDFWSSFDFSGFEVFSTS